MFAGHIVVTGSVCLPSTDYSFTIIKQHEVRVQLVLSAVLTQV